MKNYHYLYKVTHIKSKRIYYGIHSTNDLNDRYFANGIYESSKSTEGDWIKINNGKKNTNSHIRTALLKYGRKEFKKEIIEFFDTREDLIARESEIVTKEFINKKNNFNNRTGGLANIEFSDDVKKKISINNPMKRAKVRKKISIAKKKYWTDEKRKIFSKNNPMKDKEIAAKLSGKNSVWFGRKHTEDSKKKISEANKGRKRSKKAIESQKEKLKKYWEDPEKISKRKNMKGIPKPQQGQKVREYYQKNTEIIDNKSGRIYHSLDEIVNVLSSEGIKRSKSSVSEYVRGVKGKKLGLDKRFQYIKNPKKRKI